jgi:outer membrane protein OmpA-like peptidoglycan-associated protein
VLAGCAAAACLGGCCVVPQPIVTQPIVQPPLVQEKVVEPKVVEQKIVLVPDPDGRVGEVEVSTAGGTQRLTRPGDMTSVAGAAAPAAVTTADPAWLASTFGEVMAVEPAPPEKFLLYFDAGTTTLAEGSRAALTAIADAVRRRGAIAVSISGHADATGSDELNDKLALERAEAVKALLVEQGVAPGPISVTSHGKGNPAVPTPEGVPEPRNRRVEVVVQ